MKRMTALLLVILLGVSLVACSEDGKKAPSGSYTCTIGSIEFGTMTFSGNNVTFKGSTKTSKGTFKMDGNTVVISYDNGKGDKLEYNAAEETLTMPGLVFKKN